MATVTKGLLSESTQGRGILITNTGSPGTLIHTAHATAMDEIWLYLAHSSAGGGSNISIEFGGVSVTDLIFKDSLEASGGQPQLFIPGLILSGGLEVRAYAATGNRDAVVGYINRIT
jgi:hypothetical protein